MQILLFTRIELTTSELKGVRGYLLDHSGDEAYSRWASTLPSCL